MFPATRVSVLTGIGSEDAAMRHRALERIVAAYRRPVQAYVRWRYARSDDEAEELAQGFFAAAAEKEYLAAFDPAKGRFRTFLRICVERYVLKARSAEKAQRRGGGAVRLDVDAGTTEQELAGAGGIDEVERWFEREWARSIFDAAIAEVRRRWREQAHGALRSSLFERYDLIDPAERPSYAELAAELGIKVTDVTNHLAAVRRELRVVVLETLRELTASDDEFRAEARALLGVDAP
jgi:RNA polymerase sigma factor (sigma-70 family)